MPDPLTADEMSDLLILRDELRVDSDLGNKDQADVLRSLGRAIDFCETPENLVRVSSENLPSAERMGVTRMEPGVMRMGLSQIDPRCPRCDGPRRADGSCPNCGTNFDFSRRD